MITEDQFRAALDDGKWHSTRDLVTQLNIQLTPDEIGDITRRVDNFVHTWSVYTQGELLQSPLGYKMVKYATQAEVDDIVAKMKADATAKTDLADKVKTKPNANTVTP